MIHLSRQAATAKAQIAKAQIAKARIAKGRVSNDEQIRALGAAYVDDRHHAACDRVSMRPADAGTTPSSCATLRLQALFQDAGMSNQQVFDLILGCGIPVGVLGVEYGWLFASGDENKRDCSRFSRESCENAVALGCNMLMSAPNRSPGRFPRR